MTTPHLESDDTARETPAHVVAGFLAALSVTASAIGIAHKPIRLIPAAFVLALIAAAIGGQHRRLSAFAVGVAAVAFVVGLTVSVITGNDLY